MAPRKRAKFSTKRKSPKQCRFVHLPDEVVDHIATFVHSDDRRTLSNASRVCRAWFSVFHPHIFRRVEIDDRSDAIVEFMEDIRKFQDMRLWIKELCIVGSSFTDKHAVHVFEVLPKLPRLHTLVLSEVHRHPWYQGIYTLDYELQWCSSLKEVIVKDCILTVSSFSHTLRSIRNLQSLSLLSSESDDYPPESPPHPCCRIPLAALKSLKVDSSLGLAEKLFDHCVAPKIQSVEICGEDAYGSDWALRIISGFFPSLQSLTIVQNGPGKASSSNCELSSCLHAHILLTSKQVPAEARHWNPTQMSSFRTFHFSIHPGDSLMPAILKGLALSSVQEFIIEAEFDYLADLNAACTMVASAMDLPAFGSLRSFCFIYKGSSPQKKVHDRVEKIFSAVRERGISLDFVTAKPERPFGKLTREVRAADSALLYVH